MILCRTSISTSFASSVLSLVLLYLMKGTQTALKKDQEFCVELQIEGKARKESRGKVLRKYCWMYVKDSEKIRSLC